jgi:hypothetical protein
MISPYPIYNCWERLDIKIDGNSRISMAAHQMFHCSVLLFVKCDREGHTSAFYLNNPDF